MMDDMPVPEDNAPPRTVSRDAIFYNIYIDPESDDRKGFMVSQKVPGSAWLARFTSFKRYGRVPVREAPLWSILRPYKGTFDGCSPAYTPPCLTTCNAFITLYVVKVFRCVAANRWPLRLFASADGLMHCYL
jgi:hypothetical protein